MRLSKLRPVLIEVEHELGPQVREHFAMLPLQSATEDRVIAAILGFSPNRVRTA